MKMNALQIHFSENMGFRIECETDPSIVSDQYLTKTEVKAIGKELGLPERLVNKVPTDGLCGKTDEENFGFSYDMLDEYIRTGKIDDLPKQRNIECLHMMNEFKMKPMAHFEYMEEN